MALYSVLDSDTGSGGGGLVIWVKYGTLVDTAEWFIDYYTDVWNLDTDQTDALTELFVNKKGWEGSAAEQYQLLYDSFLEETYRPLFETRLCNIKGITIDAVTGAVKLLNQCDDFYLSLESDEYEPEIRMGRPDKLGSLMYDYTYKDSIIAHCESAYTETEEEDGLLDEAIEAVSNLNYPQFAVAMNLLANCKDEFIRKQKRINNYKETFTDYTEKTVEYDQNIADAYNAEVDENVAMALDYTPLGRVEPWEVECAEIWASTNDTEAMVDFIRSTTRNASVWTEATAEAISIIYVNAYYGDNTEVLTAFYDQFSITFFKGQETRWETKWVDGEAYEAEAHYDKYLIKVDNTVVERMDTYIDKYRCGEAWTALNEEYEVKVDVTNGRPEGKVTSFAVEKGEDGRLVTTVSITDADGDVVASASVAEHNMWQDMYDDTAKNGSEEVTYNAIQERIARGDTEEEIDAFHNSDEGLLARAHTQGYQMTDYEEKKVEQLVDQHWEANPEEKEYVDCMNKYMARDPENPDSDKYNNMTFEEYYKDQTGKDFDREVFEQAVYYKQIESKTSEGEAFCDGFTQTGYNIGKALDALGEKAYDALGLDEIFVPSEHDLAVQQSHEEMQQIVEWERNAEKTQNTGWYTAGHVTERVVTTAVASAVFGGEQIAGTVAEKVGGGLLTRYAVTVAGDTVVDTFTDTLPEAVNNYYDGMPTEEIIDHARDSFLGNLGMNAVTAGVGTYFKAISEAGDTVKVAEDATKTADNISDASKSFENVADGTKIADNSSDAVKAAESAAESTNVINKASDATKAVEDSTRTTKTATHAAEAEKTTAHAADAEKTAAHAAEAEKTAAHAAEAEKTAVHAADAEKTAAHAADAEKTAAHAADAEKTAAHAADAEKAADHAADAERAADHATDAERAADHAADAERAADHATDAEKAANHSNDALNTTKGEKDVNKAVDGNSHFETEITNDEIDDIILEDGDSFHGIHNDDGNIDVDNSNYDFKDNATAPGEENTLIHKNRINGNSETLEVNKKDLDILRRKLGVPETDTIAVGKTDVKGLEGVIFEGQSPKVRSEAGLPDLDEIWAGRNIKSPGNNPLFTRHAEEVLANDFDRAVMEAGTNPLDVNGVLKIHQSNPSGVCRKCIQGLANDNVSPGVLKQLSLKYPNLRIEITSELIPGVKVTGKSDFIIQNGHYVE